MPLRVLCTHGITKREGDVIAQQNIQHQCTGIKCEEYKHTSHLDSVIVNKYAITAFKLSRIGSTKCKI